MAALLFVGTLLWFKVDASRELNPESGTVGVAVARADGISTV